MAINWLDVASSLYGLYKGNQQEGMAKDAFQQSDPFGPFREGYGAELLDLMHNPDAIKETPGYQFRRDQGLEAVQRKMGSLGYGGSGNLGMALTQYAGDMAGQEYDVQANRLAGLAGANINPNFGPALSGYGAGVDTENSALAGLGYAIEKGGGIESIVSQVEKLFGGGDDLGTITPSVTKIPTPNGASLSDAATSYGYNPDVASAADDLSYFSPGVSKIPVPGGDDLGYVTTTPKMMGAPGDASGTNPMTSMSNLAQGAGGALGVYSGIKQGGVMGTAQAAAGAGTMAQAAGWGGQVAGMSLGKAIPYVGAVTGAYDTIKAWNQGDVKGGVASGAATGAAIGSIFPGIGTVIGAAVGAVVGAAGSLIHGKDYKEEKVRDKYYDLQHRNEAKGGYDTRQQIDPATFYQSVAGEFRGSHSQFPPRSSGEYGQKDEDKFIADMASKINEAYSSGVVKQGDTAQAVLDKVITPWFDKDFGGWKADKPEWVKDQQTMTLDLVNRYISGDEVDWGNITNSKSQYPVPKFSGSPGTNKTVQPISGGVG